MRGLRAQEQERLELGELGNEISYNEALIDERDAGIAEISQQIGEVNEIFQARRPPRTLVKSRGSVKYGTEPAVQG
jgi:hypothetical protein